MNHSTKNTKCKKCGGTGWVKRVKVEYCQNCFKNGCKICYLCENIQYYLKGVHKTCEICTGAGNISIS